MDIKELDQLLTEPDISCMDWELGKSILANWKASLPTIILALIKETASVKDAQITRLVLNYSKLLEMEKAECQARVERIKREIESLAVVSGEQNKIDHKIYTIRSMRILEDEWQEFWKQEGIDGS